ncbi:very low-density lipoprotein receptor-like [Mercenaria mercenaria]|uniref:very low-density lipoprotein receptor-like n=1 Tax=Mercenaria mercenaria TaxID=6596 RepID=UPI00234F9663|nr:very low-density lipoprotein receptor-like [Mercenaria mercenaria]
MSFVCGKIFRLIFVLISFAGLIRGEMPGFFEHCTPDQWSCNGACIQGTKVCNGQSECADGSDEERCAPLQTCPSSKLVCPRNDGKTTCVNNPSKCPQEKRGCGAPPDITNGRVHLSKEKSAIGAKAEIECDSGFGIGCGSTIRCLPSGRWETSQCSPSGLHCYKCKNKNSNEDCNEEGTEFCPDNKQSCQTKVEWKSSTKYKIVSKGCKNPDASSGSDETGCTGSGSKIKCSNTCSSYLCNENISAPSFPTNQNEGSSSS